MNLCYDCPVSGSRSILCDSYVTNKLDSYTKYTPYTRVCCDRFPFGGDGNICISKNRVFTRYKVLKDVFTIAFVSALVLLAYVDNVGVG